MRMPVREPGNLVTSRLVAGGVGLPRGNITPPGRHSLEAAMRPKVRFPAAARGRPGSLVRSCRARCTSDAGSWPGRACAVSLGSLSAPVVGSLPSPAGAAGLVTVLIDPARWAGNPRGFGSPADRGPHPVCRSGGATVFLGRSAAGTPATCGRQARAGQCRGRGVIEPRAPGRRSAEQPGGSVATLVNRVVRLEGIVVGL